MSLTRLYAPITIGTARAFTSRTISAMRGGTPLTLDRAFEFVDALARERKELQWQYRHAYAHWQSLKTAAARHRWHRHALNTHRELVRIERALDRLYHQLDAYGQVAVTREATHAVADEEEIREEEAAQIVEAEDAQPEWQFGLEYRARHRGSDVDLNVNLRRKDRGVITRTEAAQAFAEYLVTRHAPRGYEIARVLYRSPDNARSMAAGFGNPRHERNVKTLQGNFDSVLAATTFTDWRMGGIDE